MLSIGTIVHVKPMHEPNGDSPAVRGTCGRVVAADGAAVRVELDAPLAAEPGAALEVFFGQGDKGFRTTAAIRHYAAREVALTLTGPQEAVEGRRLFRVSTAAAPVTAQLDGGPDCRVFDLSPEGFGLVDVVARQIGEAVAVTLTFTSSGGAGASEGATPRPPRATGRAIVRHAQKQGARRYLFGFEVSPGERALRQFLQQLTMYLQRRHLRRLAERT